MVVIASNIQQDRTYFNCCILRRMLSMRDVKWRKWEQMRESKLRWLKSLLLPHVYSV